jgi:hypothetical protein
LEINLDELDLIIDRGMRAPLNDSDGLKIKTALHAMADRLAGKRSTEKMSAVLEKAALVEPAQKERTDGAAGASFSFCMSSGESFGRSMVSVSLLSLPVKRNGTW